MNTEPLTDRITRCQQHVEREPESAAARFNLGLAYTARGLVDRAEREYRAAVTIDAALVEAWVNLGGVLLLKWDFEGAVAALEQAVTRRPDLVDAHYNLGQAHLYRGDAQALVTSCRRVLDLQPDHAAGHYFLAVGLLALGDIEAARASSGRAVALGYRPLPEFLRRLEQCDRVQSPGKPARDVEAAASLPSKEN